jgi:hypothetical protein
MRLNEAAASATNQQGRRAAKALSATLASVATESV